MNDGLARLQHWCSTSFHIGCNHRRWSTFFCSLGSFAFFPFQVLVDKEISRTIDDINQISTSFDCFSNVTFFQNCIEPFLWCPKYDLKIGFDFKKSIFCCIICLLLTSYRSGSHNRIWLTTKIKLIDNAKRTFIIDFLKAALANIWKSSDDCKIPSFLYKAQFRTRIKVQGITACTRNCQVLVITK